MNISDIGNLNLDRVRQTQIDTLRRSAGTMNGTTGTPQEDEKLQEACRQFEAIFMKQMLDSMRKTVTKTGLIEGGFSEEIFEDMLYDEYADKMTRTAGFGIADMLYRQFK